jgi:hypothetical protein
VGKAEQLKPQRVLGPLLDHVPVQAVGEPFRGPVPASGVDCRVLFSALADGTDAVNDAGPFGVGEEAVLGGWEPWGGLVTAGGWLWCGRRGVHGVLEGVFGAGCRDWEGDARLSLGLEKAPGRVCTLVDVGGRGPLRGLLFAGRGHVVVGSETSESRGCSVKDVYEDGYGSWSK